MEDATLLSKETLTELRGLLDDYPYFSVARMLYLKNLAMLEDVRLDRELKRMSVFVPDRERLFMLLNAQLFATSPRPVVKESKAAAAAAAKPVKPAAAASVINTNDYVGWLEENAEDIVESEEVRLHRQELIDDFIANRRSRVTPQPSVANETDSGDGLPPTNDEVTSATAAIDDAYFTETLARVYVKQKKFDKALEIIRALNAKYPEKNIYFADQIRFLERIINLK
jgi:hypothetical protein